MKMSDVFNLPVKDVVDVYGSVNILDALSECISDGYYDDFEKSAAHAINNHDRLTYENERLKNALKDILYIVDDSTGVAGYHLNGDVADWDEFVEIRNANQLISELEGDES